MKLEDKERTAAGCFRYLTVASGLSRYLLACAHVWDSCRGPLLCGPRQHPWCGAEQHRTPWCQGEVCMKPDLSPGLIWHLCIPICLIFPLNFISSYCSGCRAWSCVHKWGRPGWQPPQRRPWSQARSLGCWCAQKSMLDTGRTRGWTWGRQVYTGQTGWLRPDSGGILAVSMYICMYFPLTCSHAISQRMEQDKVNSR